MRLLLLLTIVAFFASCVKKEIKLNEVEVPEMDASFALPLGHVHLNVGDIEQQFDQDNFIFNQANSAFELVFRDTVFEYGVEEMLVFPSQTFNYSYGLSAPVNNQFSQALAGHVVTQNGTQDVVVPFSHGELLDSVILTAGSIVVDISSEFMHSTVLDITCPYLTLNGVPYQATVNLPYTGTVPIVHNMIVDISGYVLDLTKGGTTNNTLSLDYEATVTHSGQAVLGTEQFEFNMDINVDEVKSIWGYFGQYSNVLDQDTAFVDLFANLYGGTLHFADPRVSLVLYNTTGLDAGVQFDGVIAPQNSTVQQLGGPGLTSFPIIARAMNPGDVAITTHQIDNSNTSPTLSELMDEGPSEIIYSASAETNPNGYQQNFILDTSKIWCEAEIGLPFFGYGRDFVLVDTMEANMESIFGDNVDTEIDQVMVRIIVDNGMPFDAGIQLYFTDDNFVVLDSLFQINGYENVFESGIVDFNLPPTHPDHGKVSASTRKVTDVIMTRELVQKLIANNSTQIIYKTQGNTSQAAASQDIKIFPEYTIDIKVSAKIDL